jgi:hypothetical protein
MGIMVVPGKAKNKPTYDSTIALFGIYLKCKSIYKRVPTYPCLLELSSQWPNCGNI